MERATFKRITTEEMERLLRLVEQAVRSMRPAPPITWDDLRGHAYYVLFAKPQLLAYSDAYVMRSLRNAMTDFLRKWFQSYHQNGPPKGKPLELLDVHVAR